MRLPYLFDWTSTRVGLHQAAQVIGAVRAAVATPEPNWTHVALRVVPEGLTTGALPEFGEMMLDFNTQAIVFSPFNHDPVGFALALHTQQSLAQAVVAGLQSLGFPLELDHSKLKGDTFFDLDPRTVTDYGRILSILSVVFGNFRARLPGDKSPLVVWPHGFDLAFLWFATEVTREDAPHMGFGFAPFSAEFDRPYIYSYPYPLPDGFTEIQLPPGTRWHTGQWTGTVTEYDQVLRQEEPIGVVEGVLNVVYDRVSPLLT